MSSPPVTIATCGNQNTGIPMIPGVAGSTVNYDQRDFSHLWALIQDNSENSPAGSSEMNPMDTVGSSQKPALRDHSLDSRVQGAVALSYLISITCRDKSVTGDREEDHPGLNNGLGKDLCNTDSAPFQLHSPTGSTFMTAYQEELQDLRRVSTSSISTFLDQMEAVFQSLTEAEQDLRDSVIGFRTSEIVQHLVDYDSEEHSPSESSDHGAKTLGVDLSPAAAGDLVSISERSDQGGELMKAKLSPSSLKEDLSPAVGELISDAESSSVSCNSPQKIPSLPDLICRVSEAIAKARAKCDLVGDGLVALDAVISHSTKQLAAVGVGFDWGHSSSHISKQLLVAGRRSKESAAASSLNSMRADSLHAHKEAPPPATVNGGPTTVNGALPHTAPNGSVVGPQNGSTPGNILPDDSQLLKETEDAYRRLIEEYALDGFSTSAVLLSISDAYVKIRRIVKANPDLNSVKTMYHDAYGLQEQQQAQWKPPDQFRRPYFTICSVLRSVPDLNSVKTMYHDAYGLQEQQQIHSVAQGSPCPADVMLAKTIAVEPPTSESAPISSIYFDNANLDVYHKRLHRSDGASLARVRWYGGPECVMDPNKQMFMERKRHRDAWTGEYSMKPSSKALLLRDIQAFLTDLKQEPYLRTSYQRCAFQRSDSNAVRISLDTQQEEFVCKESTLANSASLPNPEPITLPSQPAALPHSYPASRPNSASLPTQLATLSNADSVPNHDSTQQEAIICKKNESTLGVAGTDSPLPEALTESGLLVESPKFSKFLHGMACLYPSQVKNTPHWFVPMHNSSGQGSLAKQICASLCGKPPDKGECTGCTYMRPALIEEMADASDPMKERVPTWLFPPDITLNQYMSIKLPADGQPTRHVPTWLFPPDITPYQLMNINPTAEEQAEAEAILSAAQNHIATSAQTGSQTGTPKRLHMMEEEMQLNNLALAEHSLWTIVTSSKKENGYIGCDSLQRSKKEQRHSPSLLHKLLYRLRLRGDKAHVLNKIQITNAEALLPLPLLTPTAALASIRRDPQGSCPAPAATATRDTDVVWDVEQGLAWPGPSLSTADPQSAFDQQHTCTETSVYADLPVYSDQSDRVQQSDVQQSGHPEHAVCAERGVAEQEGQSFGMASPGQVEGVWRGGRGTDQANPNSSMGSPGVDVSACRSGGGSDQAWQSGTLTSVVVAQAAASTSPHLDHDQAIVIPTVVTHTMLRGFSRVYGGSRWGRLKRQWSDTRPGCWGQRRQKAQAGGGGGGSGNDLKQPQLPSSMALVRSRVEPKTFFASERTFLAWINIAVLVMFTSLSLMSNLSITGVMTGTGSTTEHCPGGMCKASAKRRRVPLEAGASTGGRSCCRQYLPSSCPDASSVPSCRCQFVPHSRPTLA
eukprot:gene11226-18855_t